MNSTTELLTPAAAMVVLHDCGSVVNMQNTRWRAWCIVFNGKAHHASAATLPQAATKDIGAVSLDIVGIANSHAYVSPSQALLGLQLGSGEQGNALGSLHQLWAALGNYGQQWPVPILAVDHAERVLALV